MGSKTTSWTALRYHDHMRFAVAVLVAVTTATVAAPAASHTESAATVDEDLQRTVLNGTWKRHAGNDDAYVRADVDLAADRAADRAADGAGWVDNFLPKSCDLLL